jgi:hypothetical protein
MSTRSKIVYLLVALLFVFTSLAGGAFAAVEMAAHNLHDSDAAFHLNGSVSAPSYSIAKGECDMIPGCGSGSGLVGDVR